MKLKVFICGTSVDMVEERKIVKSAIMRLGLVPVTMDDFGPDRLPPIEICLEKVRESDAMIILVGQLYGSIVPNTSISYSEREYEEACRNSDRKILCYIRKPKVLLPAEVAELDESKAKALALWTKKLNEIHTLRPFTSQKGLKSRVHEDLADFIAKRGARSSPQPAFAVRISAPLRLHEHGQRVIALTVEKVQRRDLKIQAVRYALHHPELPKAEDEAHGCPDNLFMTHLEGPEADGYSLLVEIKPGQGEVLPVQLTINIRHLEPARKILFTREGEQVPESSVRQ